MGGGGSAPAAPNYSALLPQQAAINLGQFNTQLGAGRINQNNPYSSTSWSPPSGFYGGMMGSGSNAATGALAGGSSSAGGGGATPGAPLSNAQIMANYQGAMNGTGGGSVAMPPAADPNAPTSTGYTSGANALMAGGNASSGPWTQNSSFNGPTGALVNNAMSGAASAAGAFNPANNPTWNGPSAGQANVGYGGPSNAGMLSFNPANVSSALYGQTMNLLEPGMQSQSQALDQSLKAQGYDVNGPGGAQTAENNLNNQQNLTRLTAADAAVGQAIPQGAQALAAQESIPLTQQSVAQGYQQGQLNPLLAGANIGTQQFNAGVTGATLPAQEAGMLTQTGLAPNSTLPGGAAQAPALSGVDLLGTAQQSYANAMSGYNASQASNSNMMGGLFGLGGTGALAYAMNPSAFSAI